MWETPHVNMYIRQDRIYFQGVQFISVVKMYTQIHVYLGFAAVLFIKVSYNTTSINCQHIQWQLLHVMYLLFAQCWGPPSSSGTFLQDTLKEGHPGKQDSCKPYILHLCVHFDHWNWWHPESIFCLVSRVSWLKGFHSSTSLLPQLLPHWRQAGQIGRASCRERV